MRAYCDGKLKKGEALYVNLVQNKAAVAVGTAFQGSEDLYMQGMRGKAINVLHCVGDQLWMSGSKTEIPDLGPSEAMNFSSDKAENGESNNTETTSSESVIKENDKKDDVTMEIESVEPSTPSIENAVSNLLLEPASQRIPPPTPDKDNCSEEGTNEDNERASQDDLDEESNEHGAESDAEIEIQEPDPRSPDEIMDELIENAFLQALKTTATAKKLELPALTSNFYRLHMLPACPSEIGGPIDIKKSSFKKLGKFLSKMVEEKVCEIISSNLI